MLSEYDFGVRSIPPCSDCDENGHCRMNCGPSVKPVNENAPILTSTLLQKIGNTDRAKAAVGKKSRWA